MNINIVKEEKYALLAIQETKVDAAITTDLKARLHELSEEGVRNMILDLEQVKYMDSSGLSCVLVANKLCSEKQGNLVIARVSDHVMKLIKISQLEKVINILPTVEESIDNILMSELEREFGEEDGDL